MTATQPQPQTPTGLPRDALGCADALNTVLADSFALFMKTKNFHWHVSGPHFRDYHLMLDNQAAQILGTTDEIAERIRKTGNTTLESIGDIARRQRIKDDDAEFVSAGDMLAELRQDNLALAQSLHEARRIVDDAGDNAHERRLGWLDRAGRGARLVPVRGKPGWLRKSRGDCHDIGGCSDILARLRAVSGLAESGFPWAAE
jgi:starvation-inducible DNA-binding protein